MWLLDLVMALCVTPLMRLDSQIDLTHALLCRFNLTGNERKFYAYQLQDNMLLRYYLLEDVDECQS